MKHLLTIITLSIVLIISGCNGNKQEGNVEATQSEIDAAIINGRDAARDFVNKRFEDTLQLSGQLLEVSARRSEYTSSNRLQERAAFDSAFISTVRAVRPGLAEQIERVSPQ